MGLNGSQRKYIFRRFNSWKTLGLDGWKLGGRKAGYHDPLCVMLPCRSLVVLVSLPARVSLAARGTGAQAVGCVFRTRWGGWGMATVFTQRWLLCFEDKRRNYSAVFQQGPCHQAG